MEFVITDGQVQLLPVPGEPERPEEAELEPRAGYLLRITDKATGIVFVTSFGHSHIALLGEAMVKDTSTHPQGRQPTQIEVMPEAALHVLKDHLAPGGVPRERK